MAPPACRIVSMSVAPIHITVPEMTLITIYRATTELLWCMGVANNYTCYHQLCIGLSLCFLHMFSNFIQLVSVVLHPVHLYELLCLLPGLIMKT